MQRAVVAIFAVAVLAMASVGRSQAAVLAEYTNEGAAPAGGRVFLQLAVKQTGADWLLQTLHEVSDPRSPRYGETFVLGGRILCGERGQEGKSGNCQ